MNQNDWFSWQSISVARNSSTSLLVAATRSLQPVCGSPGAMVRPRQGVSNRLKFRSDMFATKSWGDFSWFYKYDLIEQFASSHGSSHMPSPCCQLLSQVALFGVSYDAGAAVRAAAHNHPAVKVGASESALKSGRWWLRRGTGSCCQFSLWRHLARAISRFLARRDQLTPALSKAWDTYGAAWPSWPFHFVAGLW